jgi:hypothetical protein
MGRSNIIGGRSARYNIEGRFARYNLEGSGAKPNTTSAQKVAMQRQSRAYARLRVVAEERGLDVTLPRRLSSCKAQHNTQLRAASPELADAVQLLLRERKQTKAGIIAKSTYKRTPLPAEPAAREAERLRRAVASMRALRQRRRADKANLDLVQEL